VRYKHPSFVHDRARNDRAVKRTRIEFARDRATRRATTRVIERAIDIARDTSFA